ncbi:uncharacterized protein TNCV_17231 [Trichonephila clavipes]|nr:uncharacterized protein TNCV_17231 [Trichonephila clavipes]
MNPTCQQRTAQAGRKSVIVWGACCCPYMGPLILLDTTLTGDRNVSILSDLLHPFMSIVHSDGLGEFQQDNMTLTHPELLQRGSRSTRLNLDISAGHPNPQT